MKSNHTETITIRTLTDANRIFVQFASIALALLTCVAIVGSMALVAGCASTSEKAWKVTQQQNKLSGYRAFAEKFPESPHTPEANSNAEKLIAERKAQLNKLNAGWPKLKQGMSVTEVDELIGLDKGFVGFMTEMSRQAMAILGAAVTSNAPYECDDFTLNFKNGRLDSWSRPSN